MYFYKPLIIVALLSINVFAIDELDVGKELDKRFAVGGSMEGFRQGNKDKIRRLYRSLDPEVKTLLLRAFDHGAHMEGFFEWDKISVYENTTKIPKNAIFQAFEMFDREGRLHTATADVKLNIIGLLVNMPEEQSIGFLNILERAVQESTSQAEIRACIHSMRKFKDRGIIQYFCNLWGGWLKYKETYPSSPLNRFFNLRQCVFTVTSLLDEGGVIMAPFSVMEIMYSVFSTKPYVNEEFLKWLCLNNQAKKKVVSRLNFKGVFKKPFEPEDRAVIQEYLGPSKALPRDRVSKVQLMEANSADDNKAYKLECMVTERAAKALKMVAERAAERERKLRGLTVMSAPETWSPFMPLEEGDEPDFPSTEKESNDGEDYDSDSSQSVCSAHKDFDPFASNKDFDPFARSQTPVFGQSSNGLAMNIVPA